MANLIVDGFATYGTGNNTNRLLSNLLAGAYASVDSGGAIDIEQGLPWDDADTSYWMHATVLLASNHGAILRRVLAGGAVDTMIASWQCALAELPIANGTAGPIEFRNGANQAIAALYVQSTGIVQLNTGTETRSSSSPVIFAEKVQHWEAKLDAAAGKFILKIDGVTVINVASGLTFTHADPCAQVSLTVFNVGTNEGFDPQIYTSHLILRDDTSDFNNDFVGNRFVATLFPSADDPDHQGWTPQPLHRFGAGILDLTDQTTLSGRAAVLAPIDVVTDIGNADFTIEGQWRARAIPDGSDMGVLMGKWEEGTNQRSYQLFLGGPTLFNGNLVFRTSTDGLNGTVVNKLQWPWSPELDVWYHIAVSRTAGVLRMFIDGVQVGINVADSDTYFAAFTRPCIGAAVVVTDSVADTGWLGWQDAFRLTIGASRYTTNFSPPTEDFLTGGDDPDWADVAWLSSWNNASVADDSGHGLILSAVRGAATLTPDDDGGGYAVIREHVPNDDNFIEAALIPATGIFTLSGVAITTQTVTVGTKNGSTPAVYTFKTALASAFDVLIGASKEASIANLISAINRSAGEGTTYGTGTTANFDVAANALPVLSQLQVTALTPGAAGNAIPSTETCTNGAWGDTTLDGGADIPGYSQFYFDRLPPGATIVDSVTFVGRQFKTDSGEAKTKTSFVGVDGGVVNGTEITLGTAPNLSFDTFQEDPDSAGDPLTPQIVRTMRSKIARTV